MAYRVGFQCFDTSEGATDYKMSQVVPQILSDGTLLYPKKENGVWTYNGHLVELSHGHCDPKEDFQAGLIIALAYLGLFILVFAIKTTLRFINVLDKGEDEGREDRD